MTCILGNNGVTPHPRLTHFDENVLGLIHSIKCFEIAAARAAISGNFNDTLLALCLNPLMTSDNDAEKLVRELIIAHKNICLNFPAPLLNLPNLINNKDALCNAY